MVPAILIGLLVAAAVLVLLWRRERTTPVAQLPPDPTEVAAARIAVDRMTSVQWARRVLSNPDGYAVVLIATSSGSDEAALIGIAVADIDGSVRLNQRVRPPKATRIEKGSPFARGIRATDVKSMPGWRDVGPMAAEAIGARAIVTDDPEFVERMLRSGFERIGVEWPGWSFEGANHHLRMFKGSLSAQVAEGDPQPEPDGPTDLETGCLALIDEVWQMAGAGSMRRPGSAIAIRPDTER